MGPQLLDKYELERVIGQGGMGTVYAGKNLRTGRPVAIKTLNEAASSHGNPALARFKREARIAGTLESEHIVQVLDMDDHPTTGMPFLIMELLQGDDLQALLDRLGPLPVDVALRIAAQVCMGLHAAHEAGVVHRDIKPANLFLARRGQEVVVKILDFGVAKIRPHMPGASAVMDGTAMPSTATGKMIGSLLYMAPEQVADAKNVDARSDVFSLGLTLHAALAGKPPRKDSPSFVEMLSAVTREMPPPLADVAPWVPVDVAAIVTRATRLAREERFPSVMAMLEAIQRQLPHGIDLRENMLVTHQVDSVRVAVGPTPSCMYATTLSASDELDARDAPRDDTKKSASQSARSFRPWIWVLATFAAVGMAIALLFWK